MAFNFRVEIFECERSPDGWNKRLDETKYFESLSEADEFVAAFNAPNNTFGDPDWYMTANGPYGQFIESPEYDNVPK